MIVVTGASGTVGSTLVQLLAARGSPVRAVARTIRRLPPASAKLQPVVADLTRPDTLAAAMAGATRVYLLTPAVPLDQHVRMHRNALWAARAAGVEHVVAQSVQFAAPTAPVEVMRAHAASEDLLRGSGMRWTILRPNSFMQNLLVFAPAIRAGVLPVPGTGIRLSLVDARDVADVAATILTGDGHAGRTYELTGPAAHDFAELAEQLGDATARPVRYLPVPASQAAATMRDAGATDFVIETALAHLRYWRTGAGTQVNRIVQQLLGRPPCPFAAFATDHADLATAA